MSAISTQVGNLTTECVSEHKGISERLKCFRHEFEKGTVPLAWPEVEHQAGLMPADICDALGLTEDQQRRVLGEVGALFLELSQGERVGV